MKVLCKANSGESLSLKQLELGNTPITHFDLQVGKEYVVYAINLWKGALGYLLVGDGMHPSWYPAELFEVTQNKLPSSWHFARYNEEDGFDLGALWGYEELIMTENHYDELANLEKPALDVFGKRMTEIETEPMT
jgi:hypothetical protein